MANYSNSQCILRQNLPGYDRTRHINKGDGCGLSCVGVGRAVLVWVERVVLVW